MRNETSTAARKEALKTLTWGSVWIVGAVWVMFSGLGNPIINDLRLMRYGRGTVGEITETLEDVGEGDDGQSYWFSVIGYRFRTPDGRIIEGMGDRTSRLPADLIDLKTPVPIDVEYHPETPSLNRLKGEGSQTLGAWLLRTAGFLLLLAMLCWPGVSLLGTGLEEYRCAARGLPAGAADEDEDEDL